jgi:AbrB family looped-hinge helix DNA binding protein
MGCDIAKEDVVTKRGQTTILMEIRRKLGIKEGSRLRADAEGDRVILTKVPSVFDLAGTSKLTKEEAFKLLDKMRAEDCCFSDNGKLEVVHRVRVIWCKSAFRTYDRNYQGRGRRSIGEEIQKKSDGALRLQERRG